MDEINDQEPSQPPEWVSATRKRIMERTSVQEREKKAREATTKEEKFARLRALYEFYHEDLAKIKQAIATIMPQMEPDEICWVSLKQRGGCAEVGLFGPFTIKPARNRINVDLALTRFSATSTLYWTRQLDATSGVLWAMAEDLCAWASTIEVACMYTEPSNVDVPIPFSRYHLGDPDGEVGPRGLGKGDYVVGLRVTEGRNSAPSARQQQCQCFPAAGDCARCMVPAGLFPLFPGNKHVVDAPSQNEGGDRRAVDTPSQNEGVESLQPETDKK